MNRQYILTRSLVCCLLAIGVTDVANAQRRHKAITTEQRQPLFLVNDTFPVIGSMAKVGEKQMNKGLVNSAINALSGQAVGVKCRYEWSGPYGNVDECARSWYHITYWW